MPVSNNSNTISITKLGLTLAIIVLFGVFLRLFMLDRMAFHHDESIHALHSYQLSRGNINPQLHYDPTYHGPFLYHYGALFFILLGDNDFTARLPFVSFGILMLYFVWRLRPWIGQKGAIACLLFVAISPTLSYFSRFARNDIYMGTMALGILVFALEYLRNPQTRYLLWTSFFLALMYCCKENSYMTGFVFGSFIVFYGVYYFLQTPKEDKRQALKKIFIQREPFVKLLSLYAIFSFTAFSLVYYVSHQEAFKSRARQIGGTGSFSIQTLRTSWNEFIANHQNIIPLWVILAVVGVIALFIVIVYIQKSILKNDESESLSSYFFKHSTLLLTCLLIILTLYTFLFTTMGTNQSGMKAGVVDYLLYWMGQQFEPRISGPPDYFIPRLLIYEFLPLLLALVAFVVYMFSTLGGIYFLSFIVAFIGVVYTYCIVILGSSPAGQFSSYYVLFFTLCLAAAISILKNFVKLFSFVPQEFTDEGASSKEKSTSHHFKLDGFRLFLIYWTVLSLLIYAMLEEKVPWLIVHQSLPLILLAGTFLGDVMSWMNKGAIRTVFVCLIGLFVVYEARTSVILNFYNSDDPRETLVYTQSDHDVKFVVDQVIKGAKDLGVAYRPLDIGETYMTNRDHAERKYLVSLQGGSGWPHFWYFRHYKVFNTTSGLPPKDIPYALIIADDPQHPDLENRMTIWGEGKYRKRRKKHRVWWVYETKGSALSYQQVLPFSHHRFRNKPQSEAWLAFLRYLLYREVWTKPGSTDVYLYSRFPLKENEASPQVPDTLKAPPKPLQVIQSAGTFGTGHGQFNEPRGVTLSPDESKLYVLDAKNGRIQVFNSQNLAFIGTFSGPTSDPGGFEVNLYGGPNGGIDVAPDGTIYATDTWWNQFGRINHYNQNGELLNTIRPAGDYFYSPRGLAVDQQGFLYVSDTGNHRVVKFKPDGSYEGPVVKESLTEPVGITFGPDGLMYVCDVGGKRVAAFTPSGSFIKQWQVYGWGGDPVGIEPYVTVDKNKNIYITDSTTNTVTRYSFSGDKVSQAGGSGNQGGYLKKPKGITIDSNGNLYIADSLNHRVIKSRFQN